MKSKRYYLIALILLNSYPIFAQTPDWLWAKKAGGASDDFGWGITTDADGNVYATGHFYSANITFGNITLTNANTNGSDDLFLVKHNQSGNVVWAKSAGGTGNDGGQRICSDNHGNAFVIGDFNSSVIAFGKDTLIKGAGKNIFIVKYNSSGDAIWAKSACGISATNYGQGISVDASGNLYITGAFRSSSITFGSNILTNASVDGGDDVFIVKYDLSGNVIWARSTGGPSYEWCDAISTDLAGHAYVAGYFQSDRITFGNITLTNGGGRDIFIAKYDSSGNVIWAKTGLGISGFYGQRIANDAHGNVYVTGAFMGNEVVFDSIVVANHTPRSTDIFVAKYDTSGNIKWAIGTGGDAMEEAFGIATDVDDNVYVTGYFNSSNIKVGKTTLRNAGIDGDIFIIKYNPYGEVVWAKKAGGDNDDNGLCIATDKQGNAYVGGDFRSSAITFGNDTLTNASIHYDFFIAKLGNK